MVKIYIDPGHGGSDPGALANGVQEKDVVLKMGKKVREYLEAYNNVSVRMSRTGDTYPSLSARTRDANSWGADYFISLHCNAGGGYGYEDFIYSGGVSAKTSQHRNVMHPIVFKSTGMYNRGKKRGNFAVLRQTNMPAILTENGFVDNYSDAQKMKSNLWINEVAQGHVLGIAKCFGLKKKSGYTPPTENPSIPDGETIYRVISGSFAEKSNAESREKALKRKGFDSFLAYESKRYRVVTGSFNQEDNAEDRIEKLKKAGFDSFIDGYNVTSKPEVAPEVKSGAIDTVKEVQNELNQKYNFNNISVDNVYGKETKKALVKMWQHEMNKQFGHNLAVDGIFGNASKAAAHTVPKGSKGNLTWNIQAALTCHGYNLGRYGVDGSFGSSTTSAVKAYQRNHSLYVDGLPGKAFFSSIY